MPFSVPLPAELVICRFCFLAILLHICEVIICLYLAATIGLSGIQLFIDAGLPVDRDLVSGLIREVIEEKITTVLGHPKPTARLVSSVVRRRFDLLRAIIKDI